MGRSEKRRDERACEISGARSLGSLGGWKGNDEGEVDGKAAEAVSGGRCESSVSLSSLEGAGELV